MKLYFDEIIQNTKPTIEETKKIHRRFSWKTYLSDEYTDDEIVNKILAGYTIVPCNIKPFSFNSEIQGIVQKYWKSQQLFVIDIDNQADDYPVRRKDYVYQDLSIILEKSKKFDIPIFLITESFSSTKQNKKYHVYFKSDREITDEKEASALQEKLFCIFGDDISNTKTVQLFYNKPQANLIYYKKSFSSEKLLQLHIKREDFFEPNHYHRAEPSLQKDAISESKIINEFFNSNKSAKRKFPLWGPDFESSNKTGTVILSKSEFIEFFQQQSIVDYLNKQGLYIIRNQHFNCVLPDHIDTKASAIVQKYGLNEWYACFGKCNCHYHFIEFYEKYNNFTNREDTIDSLCSEFNLTIFKSRLNADANQYKIIENNRKNIFSTNSFQEHCPVAYNLLCKYDALPLLKLLLEIQEEKTKICISKNPDGNIFFASMSFILSKIKSNEQILKAQKRKYDEKRISQLISLMSFLKILDKVSEEDVRERFIDKSKDIQKKYNDTRSICQARKHDYIISYLDIPNIQTNYSMIEERAALFVENRLNLNNFTYEMVSNISKEIANEVFPQLKGKEKNNTQIYRSYHLERIFRREIDSVGYISKKSFIAEFKKYLKTSEKVAEEALRKFYPEMRQKYSLNHQRLNNDMREKHGIDIKNSPLIYYNFDLIGNIKNIEFYEPSYKNDDDKKEYVKTSSEHDKSFSQYNETVEETYDMEEYDLKLPIFVDEDDDDLPF